MQLDHLYSTLTVATSTSDVLSAVEDFEAANPAAEWTPLGGRENNRGIVEVSADPGRSLVERLTNAIDAVLEAEYVRHQGRPDVRTPKEASDAWLNVPQIGGLGELTPAQRRVLADRIQITIQPGEGRNARLIDVRDFGIGISPSKMPTTILGLNEGNKMQKFYLVGTYGQGGSSTFSQSQIAVIVTCTDESDVGFTVVRYRDLPPDRYKTGHYVYLIVDGQIPTLPKSSVDFETGTLIRHFGYDLVKYPSPLGPTSVYGLLNQILFSPVVPIWLDTTSVHGYRRVIKGSRNALNGAVDEGDERRRGPELAHNIPMFSVSLGDWGRIKIEYWVLERATKQNKRPSAAFVDPQKPIILSVNGQNHDERPAHLFRKQAGLPYLHQRLICHVDCDELTPQARRLLFSSTRETARQGEVLAAIETELIRVLKSDDELVRLNNEAREAGLHERNESEIRQIRQEVANLLRMQGIDVGQVVGFTAGGTQTPPDRPPRPPRPPKPPPEPIETHEPPTFVRFVWDDEKDVTLYPGQRRYLGIETDANTHYHNADRPESSRINLIVTGSGFMLRGSTPLRGGRMRLIVDALDDAQVGNVGSVRIELTRPGHRALSDERPAKVVEKPPARPGRQQATLPPFDTRPVSPDEEMWATLDWPEDPTAVASSAQMEEGILVIYYSTAFPKYLDRLRRYEGRSAAMAASFKKRYEVWLAAHSLIFQKDQQDADARSAIPSEGHEASDEHRERQERIRMATLASLFASREVDFGMRLEAADA